VLEPNAAWRNKVVEALGWSTWRKAGRVRLEAAPEARSHIACCAKQARQRLHAALHCIPCTACLHSRLGAIQPAGQLCGLRCLHSRGLCCSACSASLLSIAGCETRLCDGLLCQLRITRSVHDTLGEHARQQRGALHKHSRTDVTGNLYTAQAVRRPLPIQREKEDGVIVLHAYAQARYRPHQGDYHDVYL